VRAPFPLSSRLSSRLSSWLSWRLSWRLPWLLMAGALSAGACAGHREPVGGGGGRGGGGARGPICWGDTGCNEDAPGVVLKCVDAVATKTVEFCDPGMTCSLGRCVSQSCADAEMGTGPAGCLFYTAALDNLDTEDLKPTLIVVTNPGLTRATVYLQQRADSQASGQSPTQTWPVVQNATINGGSAGSFTFAGQPLQGTGYAPGAARRIVSDQPVTVMVVQSDNEDLRADSSSGTMLLPLHGLGWDYMAMTYQQTLTARIAPLLGARGGAAEVAVVATQSDTLLRIWAPGAPEETPPTEQVLQQDGDLFQLVTNEEGDDLSGTLIRASKPVAVFSGNVVTTYGKTAQGINTPDMAMEQMVPISEWSKSYVAARLPAQTTACDTLFASDATLGPVSYWRIVASKQATLEFSWTGQLDGLPSDPLPVTRGLPFRLVVSGEGDFVVHSNVPILMTQGMDCEATLSSAVPVDAPLGPLTFALVPNFEHALVIVRKDSRDAPPVLLDSYDISDQFVPIADGFSVARREPPSCYDSVGACVHQLTGAHGLTLRGMDVTSSYATTPMTWVKCGTDTCR